VASVAKPSGKVAGRNPKKQTVASEVGLRPDLACFLSNGDRFQNSELIIGLVSAVGTEVGLVVNTLIDRLGLFDYRSVEQIHIAKDVIRKTDPDLYKTDDEYQRVNELMTAGDKARKRAKDNSILALGAAAEIGKKRLEKEGEPRVRQRQAYIINSLKHPEEVERLRQIYGDGFYLIGVYSDEDRRLTQLVEKKGIHEDQARRLMERDADEQLKHGQRTRDTFYLADFFVHLESDTYKVDHYMYRILDIIFGHPYVTPTFDEYAMFMAYAASLRSSDLSRQVGAVMTRDNEIIATGANDCPRFGGGLYWPEFDEKGVIRDAKNGRDHTRGRDANHIEKQRIIQDILNDARSKELDTDGWRSILKHSRIEDIMEYSRSVHAEMEAVMSCARNGIGSRNATLYCTTFPCHNCAKHIVAAGIKRVVYIEPYPKSKAAEFHGDSITLGSPQQEPGNTVSFEPFVGIGPRKFFDLFSMDLGSGYPIVRKNSAGRVFKWQMEKGRLRMQLLPRSYIEHEAEATLRFATLTGIGGFTNEGETSGDGGGSGKEE
jgi:deoxycytidylate deaminase